MRRQLVAAVVLAVVSSPQAVEIQIVPIGNPGNANDTHGAGYGSVGYVYNVGTYEVTAGQYTEFLNAVAQTDTYRLYSTSMLSGFGCNIHRIGSPGSYTYSVAADWADRPVNHVSWGDAVRFSNWLHNGQPVGPQGLSTTEDGSYFLNGATNRADLMAVMREVDATWVIPTEDEWYKAAFHKNDGTTGNYFNYPTSSDTAPSNYLVDPDPGNNATFADNGYTIGSPYYRTEVGAHENSGSPYGTFDQGGNVREWTEAVYSDTMRVVRNGDYYNISVHVVHRNGYNSTQENTIYGFRVALVPEPGTIALLALGGVAILSRGRR